MVLKLNNCIKHFYLQGYDLGWIELKASNKGESKQKFLAKPPKDYVKFIDVVLISDNIYII